MLDNDQIETTEEPLVEEVVEAVEETTEAPPEVEEVAEAAPADDGLVLEVDAETEVEEKGVTKILRQELKAAHKKLAELQKAAPAPAATGLRPKPERFDHNFDDEAYADDLEKWVIEKQAFENEQNEVIKVANAKADAFKTAIRALVPDAEERVQTFQAEIPPLRQNLIIRALGEQGAPLVAALARNPAKLAELKGIKDDVEFVATAVRLSMGVKMAEKKPIAGAETVKRGNAAGGLNDWASLLAKAEEKADRDGNRNHVREVRKRAEAAGVKL